jgi:hypothetical protein
VTVSDDEAQEPTIRVLSDRPALSGPLRAFRDTLKPGGCAIDNLAKIIKLDNLLAEDDPAFGLMTWVWQMHAPAQLGLGSMLLRGAHLQNRRQVRARVVDEGWPIPWRPDQAAEEFHRITEWVILCEPCHTLFDGKRIPERIVHAAQRQMWATPIAGDALRSFINTSLSLHSGHKMDPKNVLLALDLLHRYHDAREPFVVNPRPRKLRGMSFVVDPAHRSIHCRFGNDTTNVETTA